MSITLLTLCPVKLPFICSCLLQYLLFTLLFTAVARYVLIAATAQLTFDMKGEIPSIILPQKYFFCEIWNIFKMSFGVNPCICIRIFPIFTVLVNTFQISFLTFLIYIIMGSDSHKTNSNCTYSNSSIKHCSSNS